jgi:hypothetical protein
VVTCTPDGGGPDDIRIKILPNHGLEAVGEDCADIHPAFRAETGVSPTQWLLQHVSTTLDGCSKPPN